MTYRANYQPKYEPFLILGKKTIPWSDERFVGYGAYLLMDQHLITSVHSVHPCVIPPYNSFPTGSLSMKPSPQVETKLRTSTS